MKKYLKLLAKFLLGWALTSSFIFFMGLSGRYGFEYIFYLAPIFIPMLFIGVGLLVSVFKGVAEIISGEADE